MKPKKLIRSGIVDKLQPHEVETITDMAELNKLYALKVREELQEIIDSEHKDILEFVDLLDVTIAFAMANGFHPSDIYDRMIKKSNEKGNFSNLALNNLNPNNPSNKLYFEKKRETIVMLGKGVYDISYLRTVLKAGEDFIPGNIIHVNPNQKGSIKSAIEQMTITEANGLIARFSDVLKPTIALKPTPNFHELHIKSREDYTISQRSHLPHEPTPSARRDRRKKRRI